MTTTTTRRPVRPWRGTAFVLAAAALFAVNGTVSKVVLGSALSAAQLVQLRCTLAALVFALIAVARDRTSLRIGRRELAAVGVYGIVGVAMVQFLYYVAIARMPVSVSLLIEFTAPVMIALWVKYVRRGPVHARVWPALGLVVVGLALVARVWDGLTIDGLGLAAAGAAAVALAAYYLLGEHLLDTGTRRRDPFSLAAWSFGAAAVFWTIVQPPTELPWAELAEPLTVGRTGVSAPVWLLVVYVAVLGTVGPFGLTLMALGEIGSTRTGLLATAEPPLAGLVAWPALGETLLPVQLLGGAVVLAGIVLAETARTPTSLPPPESLAG